VKFDLIAAILLKNLLAGAMISRLFMRHLKWQIIYARPALKLLV
jgi:hypothetical protein